MPLMPEDDPGRRDLIEQMTRLLDRLEDWNQRSGGRPGGPMEAAEFARLQSEALRLNLLALRALTASIGECQMDEPYAGVRYVFKDGKQYRCCTHKTPHCFEVK